MSFEVYTDNLNELVKKMQTEKELIEDIDVIRAIGYINNIYINNTGDCLIFLSAINLCNAYVKQNDSKIDYYFKKCITKFIEMLNDRDISNVYVNKIKDNSTLYLFQVSNIQFSFHDEKIVDINSKYLRDLNWDGIRKQNCAKTIFLSAINNNIDVSNKSIDGSDLNLKISNILDDYYNKKINIEDLLIIHI